MHAPPSIGTAGIGITAITTTTHSQLSSTPSTSTIATTDDSSSSDDEANDDWCSSDDDDNTTTTDTRRPLSDRMALASAQAQRDVLDREIARLTPRKSPRPSRLAARRSSASARDLARVGQI